MTFTDRSGRLASFSATAPGALELGCGPSKRDPAALGVDLLDHPGVDVLGAVLPVLASLPDASVRSVYSAHLFEHLPDLDAVFAASRLGQDDAAARMRVQRLGAGVEVAEQEAECALISPDVGAVPVATAVPIMAALPAEQGPIRCAPAGLRAERAQVIERRFLYSLRQRAGTKRADKLHRSGLQGAELCRCLFRNIPIDILGIIPVIVLTVILRIDQVLQARITDHEEFVKIAHENGREPGLFQDRVLGIHRLFQHALVEKKPADITVNEFILIFEFLRRSHC